MDPPKWGTELQARPTAGQACHRPNVKSTRLRRPALCGAFSLWAAGRHESLAVRDPFVEMRNPRLPEGSLGTPQHKGERVLPLKRRMLSQGRHA